MPIHRSKRRRGVLFHVELFMGHASRAPMPHARLLQRRPLVHHSGAGLLRPSACGLPFVDSDGRMHGQLTPVRVFRRDGVLVHRLLQLDRLLVHVQRSPRRKPPMELPDGAHAARRVRVRAAQRRYSVQSADGHRVRDRHVRAQRDVRRTAMALGVGQQQLSTLLGNGRVRLARHTRRDTHG